MPTEHLNPYKFKKGVSGNKSGRPKAVMTMETVRRAFQVMGSKYVDELEAIVAGKFSAFDKSVAQTWLNAVRTGDMQELTRILDRAVGKVKDSIEMEYPKPFIVRRINGEEIVLGSGTPKEIPETIEAEEVKDEPKE